MSRADVQRMLEKESQQASRSMPGGRVELTGATEHGVLVELTSFDVERMGGAEVLKYQERRRKQIADKEAKADAEAAYKAMRNDEAERAALLADDTARQQHLNTTKAAI